MPWYVMTILGIAGGILGPAAANCQFDSQTCAILGYIAAAITAFLGITHGGNIHLNPNNVIPKKDQIDARDELK